MEEKTNKGFTIDLNTIVKLIFLSAILYIMFSTTELTNDNIGDLILLSLALLSIKANEILNKIDELENRLEEDEEILEEDE